MEVKSLPECDECGNELEHVPHPANSIDWAGPNGGQGYSVYLCQECGDYFGQRWKWTPEGGASDNWHCFGPDIHNVIRHF